MAAFPCWRSPWRSAPGSPTPRRGSIPLGLTPDEAAATQRLLDEAQALLPRTHARDARRHHRALVVLARHERARPRRPFGAAAQPRAAAARCSRPILADGSRALAAVLHELAHFHDRASRISRDPRFLDLAGWQVRATRFNTRVAGRVRENRFVDRSPDAYELTEADGVLRGQSRALPAGSAVRLPASRAGALPARARGRDDGRRAGVRAGPRLRGRGRERRW